MLLQLAEPTEAGFQDYQFLLREEQKSIICDDALYNVCHQTDVTDFLVFPGGFDLDKVLNALKGCKASVHIDANFEPDYAEKFEALG